MHSFLHCVNALDTNLTAGDYQCVAGTPRRKTKQVSHHTTGLTSPWLLRDVAFPGLLKRLENCDGPLQSQSGQMGL